MQNTPPTTGDSVVYLALGSNLGDRRANLAAAVERLRAWVKIEAISSLYETEPAYRDDQPRYLNAALRGRTLLEPPVLLAFLKRIERDLGRAAGPRFGPRVIDLDILLYGELVLDSDELAIPHPRMAERPFVLVPLAEIAPRLVPPGWTATIGDLAGAVRGHGDVIAMVGRLDHPPQAAREV
jgi:2-amino-4-hydroxy-6-hydroxymethyldihydropteridine diphosphokinase